MVSDWEPFYGLGWMFYFLEEYQTAMEYAAHPENLSPERYLRSCLLVIEDFLFD